MATKWIIGIDEVGRGPLAGPVTVCAIVVRAGLKGQASGLTRDLALGFGSMVRDSKSLSPRQREAKVREFKELRARGLLDWRVDSVSARVIDQRGIVSAVRLAIARALKKLLSGPAAKCEIFLDGGLRAPQQYIRQRTIVRGDASVPIIAAASIIAKVHQDRYMTRQARVFPQYGFERHKGYGTRAHYAALAKHGPSPLHRRTFL